ncbi:hypothetical protein C8J57DRAFT_1709653 [Mycena rebaudengoi]|nr:hypothetical protein C8J57DRAFT_1709653 [Mycena rebaudengoi]
MAGSGGPRALVYILALADRSHQWLFLDSGHQHAERVSDHEQRHRTFLSYSTAPVSASAIRAQIVGNQAPSLWSFNPLGGPLIETVSGLALTSRPVGASASHPFTLEGNNASGTHQNFKIVLVKTCP